MRRYFILFFSCILGAIIQIVIVPEELMSTFSQNQSINFFINYFFCIVWAFAIYKTYIFIISLLMKKETSSNMVRQKLSDTPLWKLIADLDQVNILEIDTENTNYLFKIKDITFRIKNLFELRNLFDIFIRECYGYKIAKKTIVLDIGANIGLASLYFAENSMVEKVFSYEPVRETYERAIFNINKNINLAKKIEIHNFGISNNDEECEIVINPDHLTAASTFSSDSKNNNIFSNENSSVYTEKISLISINNILALIYKDYPHHNILLKIDCEGSEYDIFEALDLYLYNNINTIIVEWHGQDSIVIEERLKTSGFEIFSIEKQKNELFGNIGVIYSVRTTNKSN